MSIDQRNKVQDFERFSIMKPINLKFRQNETKVKAAKRFAREFDKKLDRMKYHLRCQSLDRNVYPSFAMQADRAPRMIFLPDKQVCRILIRAIVSKKATEKEDMFLLRFALVENPNSFFNTPID